MYRIMSNQRTCQQEEYEKWILQEKDLSIDSS